MLRGLIDMRIGEKTVNVEHSNSRIGWYKYLGVRFLVLHRRLSEFVSKISGLHIRVIYCIQFFLDVMHVSQFSIYVFGMNLDMKNFFFFFKT